MYKTTVMWNRHSIPIGQRLMSSINAGLQRNGKIEKGQSSIFSFTAEIKTCTVLQESIDVFEAQFILHGYFQQYTPMSLDKSWQTAITSGVKHIWHYLNILPDPVYRKCPPMQTVIFLLPYYLRWIKPNIIKALLLTALQNSGENTTSLAGFLQIKLILNNFYKQRYLSLLFKDHSEISEGAAQVYGQNNHFITDMVKFAFLS